MDLFEHRLLDAGAEDVHIVYFHQAESGVQRVPVTPPAKPKAPQSRRILRSLVAPLHWFRSWVYWNLAPFADVVVKPPPATHATLTQLKAGENVYKGG